MGNRRDFQALTALKGLFILIIVLHNTLSITPLFDAFPGISFIVLFGGTLGNSMFFILSGFLLAVNYRERISSRTIGFQDFLARRLLKLYPIYLITNFVSLLTDISRYGASAVNISKIVSTLLLQGGGGIGRAGVYNNPTWFVCALFVCYIVYFCIAYHANHGTKYCCALVIGMVCGYTLISADLNIPYCTSSNGIGFMNFFLGCILAELYPRVNRNAHRWLQPAVMVLLAVFLYLMFAFGIEIICGDVNVAFAFAVCPMILYLAFSEGICSTVLKWKPIVYLGKISSAVFFWHLVLYHAFCDVYGMIAGNSPMREPQYLLYMLILAAWSAFYTERVSPKVPLPR